MGSQRITPEELDALLVIMRKHGAYTLRVPGLRVELGAEPIGYRLPVVATSPGPDGTSPEAPPAPDVTASGVPLPPGLAGRVDGSDPLYDSAS